MSDVNFTFLILTAVVGLPLMLFFLIKTENMEAENRKQNLDEIYPNRHKTVRRTVSSNIEPQANPYGNLQESTYTTTDKEKAVAQFALLNNIVDRFLEKFPKSAPTLKGRNRGWKNSPQSITLTLSEKNFVYFDLYDIKIRSGEIHIEYAPYETPVMRVNSAVVILMKNQILLNECYQDGDLDQLEETLNQINNLIDKNLTANNSPPGRRLESEVDWDAIDNATFVGGQALKIDTLKVQIVYASASKHTVTDRIVDISDVIYLMPEVDDDGSIYLDDANSITGFTGFCNYKRAERTFSPERTLSMVITETGELLETPQAIKEYLFSCMVE